jgi:peptidoglycan/LPS O-acetylase OafA/YrhL
MKRAIILFVVVALVLASTVLWIFSSNGNFSQFDVLTFGIITIVVAFALFVGYQRLTSARRGEPVEDELSKKVLQKTAALSYYISLYLWVAMIYIKDRVTLDTEELLGAGILGMALVFALSWLFFHFRGIRNE